jgi:hypothetical protein
VREGLRPPRQKAGQPGLDWRPSLPLPRGRTGPGPALPSDDLSTPEIGLVQSASLARGEARLAEYLDNPLGEKALLRRDRRRVSLPAKLRANVLVQPTLGAGDLVRTAMQVAYLIEEGFELGLVERAHSFQYAGASFLRDTS